MDTPELRIRRIAQSQNGTITRRQALAAGFTDDLLHRRVQRGLWQRLGQGVYLLFGEPSDDARLAGAIFALPAVVSHSSAARLHSLRVGSDGPEVTAPHRLSNRFIGVTVHESTDLDPGHVTEIADLPVTTPARTIFDVALRLRKRQLRRVVDEAIVRRLTSVAGLHEILTAVGRRGRPGTAAMRELLGDLSVAHTAPESELENRMLELLDMEGFTQPVLQMAVPWRASVDGRVDIAFPDERLIIECDGRRWHTLAESFERDRRRDNLAQAAGWRVLRFTWADITDRPLKTVRQIRAVLQAAA